MNKILLKIFFILLLISVFFISCVYATNINLDLPGINSEDNNTISNNTNNLNNTITNSTNSEINTDSNSASTSTTENTDENVVYDDILSDDFSSLPSETLSASDISSSAETGLGITNIINILLITVGVILVLLAIAILIRLKG